MPFLLWNCTMFKIGLEKLIVMSEELSKNRIDNQKQNENSFEVQLILVKQNWFPIALSCNLK